eukprot:1098634-Prymnesium_polylepis.1
MWGLVGSRGHSTLRGCRQKAVQAKANRLRVQGGAVRGAAEGTGEPSARVHGSRANGGREKAERRQRGGSEEAARRQRGGREEAERRQRGGTCYEGAIGVEAAAHGAHVLAH